MNVPSGYSALDLVGFTDKGDYSPSENYVKNDLVHYNDKIWECLIDDTTGIVPTKGVNWDIWIDQSNSLDGLADVEITNATDGQELSYDGTVQKWKNTSKIQTLTNQVNDIVNVLGAKNLLPNNATTQVINGVTFTVNDDGSITANGTATADAEFRIQTSSEHDKEIEEILGKSVIYSGCPSGGSTSTYQATFWTPTTGTFADNGNGVQFNVPSDMLNNNFTIAIVVRSGYTASDLTFYPMIRPASIEDSTYVPYAKSNRELTEDVSVKTNTSGLASSVGAIQTQSFQTVGKITILTAQIKVGSSGCAKWSALANWTNSDDTPYPVNTIRTAGYIWDDSASEDRTIPLAVLPSGQIQPIEALTENDIVGFTISYIHS